MKSPKGIKKWATRKTAPDGGDSYFRTKMEAVLKAQALLALGVKRAVHIARFSGTKWAGGSAPTRAAYSDVETWGIRDGVIRRIKS